MEYIYSLPIQIILLSLIIYIPTRFFFLKRRNQKISIFKEFIYIFSIIYLESLLYLTVFPANSAISNGWPGINLMPFNTIGDYLFLYFQGHTKAAVINLIGNIIVFVPLGILLVLMNGNITFKRIFMAGFLFSLGIELTQLVLSLSKVLSRSFDIDDLILNTLGVVIGYFIMKIGMIFIIKTKD